MPGAVAAKDAGFRSNGLTLKQNRCFPAYQCEVSSSDFLLSAFIMAKSTLSVIQALRATAQRLATEAPYQWGHMGSCNCGHLAQTVTRLTKGEIHARAMQRAGDWERQLTDYCPTSGLPIDETIDEMLALGFTRTDLAHLERLSDAAIRRAIPFERRNALRHNQRDDVVLYLRTWAGLLETALLDQVRLPELTETAVVAY
jgi:hypothetical protein